MTYPITPAPNIHTDPTAQADLQKQLDAEKAALQQMFSQLIPQIVSMVVNTVMKAMGINVLLPDWSKPVGPQIQAMLDQLESALKIIPGSNVSGPTADMQSLLNGLGGTLQQALAFLTGTIDPSRLSTVPVTSLSGDNSNLAPTPGFPAGSINENPDWDVDMSNSRSSDGTGAAKVIADGSDKILRSGVSPTDVIAVSAGQTYSASYYVSHTGYTGSGASVALLQVVPYTSAGEQTPVQLDSYTPTGADLAWPGHELSGQWTVPTGVIGLQDRIVVTSAATAGEFWVDDVDNQQNGKILQEWVQDLTTTWDEITALFTGVTGDNGSISTSPTQTVSQAIAGMLGQFFTGGPFQVLVQNQLSVASGVPQSDATAKLPWLQMPAETWPVAIGMQWADLTKADQSIPAGANTQLTGWSQPSTDPVQVTIASNKWSVPFSGMWHFEIVVGWSGSTIATGGNQVVTLNQNGSVIRTNSSFGTAQNIINVKMPAADTDTFSVWAQTGAALSVLGANTFVRITFLGATTVPNIPNPTPVTFGSIGHGDHGAGTIQWSHTLTADDTAIVIPISHENINTPHLTISGWGGTIPVLSGPTYIGDFSGANSYSSFAAMLLPAGMAGTTITITCDWGGQGNAASANSISFKNCQSIGTVVVNNGNGSSSAPRLNIPSNATSMLVCQFAGTTGSFSSFDETSVDNWSFSAFDTWAHQIGYAVGGSTFTASYSGTWRAKGIELHPNMGTNP